MTLERAAEQGPDRPPQRPVDPAAEPKPPIRCAGFVRRAVATLVDMLIFLLASVALLGPVGSAVRWSDPLQRIDRLAEEVSDPVWLGHLSAMVGLWVALWWCYFVVGWGLAGATPGKWLLGLRVVDHRGRCPVGAVRAVLRLAAYSVSSLTLGAGHLLVLLRSDHRALHDILAGTRVVSAASLDRDPRDRAASDGD